MQALVYIFIFLAALGVAAAAYFGLTFTPIEAVLTGLVALCIAVVILERMLRRRAEARLERGIEDLSRLLSTDAQAGQVLSQRLNEMSRLDVGPRLETMESDVSVLGTVVQQVAEAVAELEDRQDQLQGRAGGGPAPQEQPDDDRIEAYAAEDYGLEGRHGLTIEQVEQALAEGLVAFHMQPVVTLPQRRVCAYDLLLRVEMESGAYADPLNDIPRTGSERVMGRLELMAFEKACAIARQARSAGEQVAISTPLSRATLADPRAVEKVLGQLEGGKALAKDIEFLITEQQWRAFNAMERHALAGLIESGAGISLTEAKTLKANFGELEGLGVRSVRVDAARFINQPESYTDFHSSDVASYIARYGVDLIVAGVRSEQQILSLLEDGVHFAQGSHIAPEGPVPAELAAGAETARPEPAQARS